MTKLWVGIDIGTTVVKAAAFTPDGRAAALADTPSHVSRGRSGEAEQDMHGVWRAVCTVLSALMRDVEPRDVAAIGLCGQGDGLWALDEAFEPVGPAMLWSDARAAEDVTDLLDGGRADPVALACHTSLWPGTSGALLRWLRATQGEVADRIAHVGYCADWIGYRLTGRHATDLANATIPFLDFATDTYAPEALEALECRDFASALNTPRRASERLGEVTQAAAAATGLPRGVPVATGTLDLAAMLVGMGLDRPGQMQMILGTTAVVNVLVDTVTPSRLPAGASVRHATADLVIRVLAPTTGAAAFDWFTALHPMSLGGDTPAEVAEKLNAVVRDVPPGANGVTFLPYLNGERAPFVETDARGVFYGLTQNTTKADMGRAVMEGAAFSLRHCFAAEGVTPTEPVRLTGGGARNPLWCQIVADVVGAPVLVGGASDHGLWGAACLGAAAAGHGEAVALSAREEALRRFDPDAGAVAAYDAAYDAYETLSAHMRPLYRTLARKGRATP